MAIEHAIGKQTKAVLINTPNNPTGVVYDEKSLEGLWKTLEEEKSGVRSNDLPDYR